MAANFPNSPSNGQTFTSNSITFTWDGSAWKQSASPGVKGLKGEKGEKGEKGQKGEKGDKGQKGEVGLTGNPGGDGDKGDKGDKGQKGQDGNDATGTKGQKGEKGEKGQEGAQGTGGDKGQKGEQNDKGQKGEPSTVKGQKGEVGAQGDGGSDGIKGQKGEKGEVGDKGQKGEDGDKGQKGEIGPQGNQGTGGNPGTKGQKGEEGPQGGGAPVGQIVAWSGSAGSLPTGYFLCDGSGVSRTTYAALFAIVGTTHGSGNGSTTFNLPDLRDRFIVGASNSTGDSTYPGVSPGADGGSADATLVSHSHTVNNHTHSFSSSHTHSFSASTNNQGAHVHNLLYDHGAFGGTSGAVTPRSGNTPVTPGISGRVSSAGGHTHSISGTTGSGTASGTSGGSTPGTNSQGSSATNANLPPYYALAYIIQYAQGGETAKGQKGEGGDKGQKGEQNDKGQKGEIGAGTKGQKGESGSKGQKGEDGTQGVGGIKGEKGQKGQGGSDGSDGDKGQKGEIGTQGTGGNPGAKGEKGQKGEQGAGGTDGNPGAKGQKGEEGSDGTSVKGQKGEAGPVAGSANQVVYKNSSNVATGSNNLTFDGNILKLPSTSITDDNDGTYTVNGAHIQLGTNASNCLQLFHSDNGLSCISEVGPSDLSIITNGTNLYIQKDATAGYAEDMIHCIANGAVKLFYDGGSTAKVETTTSGAKVNGNLEVTGTISPSGMIVNARTSGYSLVASDAGKLVTMTTGDCSVLQNVFSAGNAVTVYNNSNNAFSILQGSGVTMYLAGTTSSGNRTLRGRGMATIVCVASNTFSIAGSGLS